MSNEPNGPRGLRDPEHSEQYEQHDVPATSQTAPSSHGDPKGFMENHAPVVWWIFGGLALFAAVGVTAGVVLYSWGDDEGGDRLGASGDQPGVSGRATEDPSAVAGVGAGDARVVITTSGFSPASLVVPEDGSVTFVYQGSGGCELKIGDEAGRNSLLTNGQEHTWEPDAPGEYELSCEGSDIPEATLTVP
jgi:hypothetical protein